MKRPLVVVGLGVGALSAAVFASPPSLTTKLGNLVGLSTHAEVRSVAMHDDHGGDGHAHGETHDEKEPHDHSSEHGGAEAAHDQHDEEGGNIKMAAAQIEDSGIEVQPAGSGVISKRLRVPGTIIPDRNHVGRVPSKVVGTVAELKKRLGDLVEAGEVIAILDSREVADAKSEYIASIVNADLQDTLYQREKTLWDKRVSSEQRLLRAEATNREAQVRRDVARQKLSALGVNEATIAKLSEAGQSATALERYEIKAPVGGRIVEQMVDVGTPMGSEGQVHELFAIADLSTVWVELTVSTQDLHHIKEGQRLTIEADGVTKKSAGTIIFTSPLLNQETRTARVIASVNNADGAWRPGSFVTAEVSVSQSPADLVIRKTALQTIKGKTVVFVRTNDGFESRPVAIGNDDGGSIEIKSGLKAGDVVAVANTFLLKAELGKSEAEHVH